MTQYSAFGVNGNGASGPGSSISYGGAFTGGLTFGVTSSGQYLYGFSLWRADSGQPSTAAFALWAMSSATTATLVSGTSASISAMTAGQWNYVALASPVALTAGTVYKAVYGVTGNFCDTQHQFNGTGTYPGGITNGPLTVYSAPTAHGGTAQAPYTNAYQGTFGTSGADPAQPGNFPVEDDADSNFWIDVLVGPAPSTSAGAGVAASSVGAPGAVINTDTSTHAVAGVAACAGAAPAPAAAATANAGAAAAPGSSGAFSLTMTYASTDGSTGIESWTSGSPANSGGSHTVRILRPASPPAGAPHVFLYCLPVSVEGDTAYGSALDICQGLGTHNTYNVTIVEPTFGAYPWYADNPLDGTMRHESFTVAVVNWCRVNITETGYGPAPEGSEAHHLIGFSKSGVGGMGLLLRHAGLFGKGAFWDTPFDMNEYNEFDSGGSTAAYGTQDNFIANYELTSDMVAAHDATFATISRIWISGGVLYTGQVTDFDTLLTGLGIPHAYVSNSGNGSHVFASQWVSPAVAAILGAPGFGQAQATAPAAVAGVGAPAGAAAVSAAAPATEGSTSAPAAPAAAAAQAPAPAAGAVASPGAPPAVAAAAAPQSSVTAVISAPAGAAGASAPAPGATVTVSGQASAAAGRAAAGAAAPGAFIAVTMPAGAAAAGAAAPGASTVTAVAASAPAGPAEAAVTTADGHAAIAVQPVMAAAIAAAAGARAGNSYGTARGALMTVPRADAGQWN